MHVGEKLLGQVLRYIYIYRLAGAFLSHVHNRLARKPLLVPRSHARPELLMLGLWTVCCNEALFAV